MRLIATVAATASAQGSAPRGVAHHPQVGSKAPLKIRLDGPAVYFPRPRRKDPENSVGILYILGVIEIQLIE